MTAQQDDLVNSSQDFTYPNVAQGNTGVTPVADPSPATVQAPAPQTASPTQMVSGPEITGEPIVDSPSPIQDPQVLDLQPEPEINTITPSEVNEKEAEAPKGGALKSLAQKLAQLKSELIEEKPEESSQESNIAPEISPLEDLSQQVPPINEIDTNLQSINDGLETDTVDASSEVLPQVEMPVDPVPMESSAVENEVVAETQPQEPISEPSPVESIDSPVPSFAATSSTTPAISNLDDIMPGSAMPEVSSEMAQEQEQTNVNGTVEVEEVPGVSLEEAIAKEENKDSMVDTGPEALMGIGSENNENSVEPTQISSGSDAGVIDENSTATVSTTHVKDVTSKGGKYPLTISQILEIAIEKEASDIQISVGYPVMIRIDGTLIAVHEYIVSPENAEELILPVLSEQKKELLEVNREVDLAYTHENGSNARFRINAYYARQSLSAAFRLIPSKIRTVEELQLPPVYNQFAAMKQGLILVTGPTGHGKSTTLAAILQSVNMNRAAHMVTIEDPIEYIFPKSRAVINQREMHDDTHSWTIALKSALRQDPDVILVGEMRDYETIAATVTLAETGHLVFATLHTNSASQTVDRIIDVFPENQQAQIRAQLANILEAVIAQRLIPLEGGGRRAVSEIMLGTPAIRNLIREGKTHQIDNVIRTSADVGMVSLEHALVKLVREGHITSDKAQEYAVHPEEVIRLLKN